MKLEVIDGSGCNLDVYLIEKKYLVAYFNSYHTQEEFEFINSKCTNEPKSQWFTKANDINRFIVPVLIINEKNDIVISNGRHRVCWMINNNLNEIPVALDQTTKTSLEVKGISLKQSGTIVLPIENLPADPSKVQFPPELEAQKLMGILKSRSS